MMQDITLSYRSTTYIVKSYSAGKNATLESEGRQYNIDFKRSEITVFTLRDAIPLADHPDIDTTEIEPIIRQAIISQSNID